MISSASPEDTFGPGVSLNSALIAAGVVAFGALYLAPRLVGKGMSSLSIFGSKLVNPAGNAIPSGPVGLSILGGWIVEHLFDAIADIE